MSERHYLDLLAEVLAQGARKPDRTGTGTLSVFGRQLRFALGSSFPLLTTKKLHLKSILYELLWFLRGETNVKWLQQRGVTSPEELRKRDRSLPAIPDETVEEGVLRLYKTKPELQILFELMADFDEGFQEWRYRHIKLVERTIGSKRGTAGSLGVEFLKQSLFKPIFADLWAIRHRL